MNIFQNILDEQLNNSPDSERETESQEEYQHIDDKIKNEKHRELVIKNEQSENNLIPKKMIQAIIGDISHSIQTNFIDLPKRESHTIAARLGIPEKERELEKLFQEKIKMSVTTVKRNIEKLLDDGIYE